MADSQRKTAQLFDKDNVNSVNAYFNSSNPSLITSDNAKCIYIQCEPNTTYTVNKAVSSRFFVGSCETEPQVGTVVNNTVGGNDWQGYLTITTGNSDLYLVAFVYRAQDTMTFAELCDTIMINKGSVALPWQPYSSTGWVHSLRKLTTATDTFTTLPVNIYADGNNAAVGLKGNTVQNGTPTPSNPVDVNGVGELTDNLFDGTVRNAIINDSTGEEQSNANWRCSNFIEVSAEKVALSWTSDSQFYQAKLGYYEADKTFISIETIQGYFYSGTFTIPNNCKHIKISYSVASGKPVTREDIMLNTGSIAKPYEPYGYKIPISSASTTTPVYLGEVQSTRKIKKYNFTGEETVSNCVATTDGQNYCVVFRYDDIGMSDVIDYEKTMANISYPQYVSSHFVNKTDNYNDYKAIYDGQIGANDYGSTGQARNRYIIFCVAGLTTAAEYSAWLAAQYAAGTPVTVWYVLASETTGIVNEPLMKIGDYADEVSGITVPTITGKDTVDVETTLKPSEVSLSYTGWHDATVKIKLENLFDNTNAQSGYLTSTGSVVEGHQNLRYTDYLSIPSGISNITQSWTDEGATLMNAPSMCFYTDNKTFISGEEFSNSNPKTFSVPMGAAYVRTCFRTFYTDIVLNEGDTPNWK